MLNAVQPGTRTIDGATVQVLADVAAMARAAADEARGRDAGRRGLPGDGPRHVRHRQLPAGLRARPWCTRRRGCPGPTRWSSTWTSTSGSGRTTRRASSAGSGSASWSRPTRRPPTTWRGLGDPEAECRRYGDLLRQYPLDLCCLGVGENGHLAFNDPPVADFADPLRRQGGRARGGLPAAAGQRGPLPRPRRRPGARHHGDHPGPAAGRPRAGHRPRGAQGGAGGGRADRARSPRRARPLRCGRSPTPPSTSSPTRRDSLPD